MDEPARMLKWKTLSGEERYRVLRLPVLQLLALLEVLKARKIAGAGLDVFTVEPINPHHPLLQLENVVLSPHLGFVSVENYERSFSGAIDNIRGVALQVA